MVDKRDDGGPAFPEFNEIWADTKDQDGKPCKIRSYHANGGMTLRDYFAATVGSADLARIKVKADREALAGRKEPDDSDVGVDGIKFNLEVEAALRYLYAEAMLETRK